MCCAAGTPDPEDWDLDCPDRMECPPVPYQHGTLESPWRGCEENFRMVDTPDMTLPGLVPSCRQLPAAVSLSGSVPEQFQK